MQLKHFDHDGRARFVTFSTHQRLPILSNDLFRQTVVESIDKVRKASGFRLLAYVIMPEHVHLVLIPRIDLSLGQIIGEIKRISARKIHAAIKARKSALLARLTVTRNGRQRFALWERRCYDHNCRTDESIWEKVMYCHSNPVKRGLANDPTDWLWSSYRWYAGVVDSVLEIDNPV
jgi:putative transposase